MRSAQKHMPHFLRAETGKPPRGGGRQSVVHCGGTPDHAAAPLWRREAALKRRMG